MDYKLIYCPECHAKHFKALRNNFSDLVFRPEPERVYRDGVLEIPDSATAEESFICLECSTSFMVKHFLKENKYDISKLQSFEDLFGKLFKNANFNTNKEKKTVNTENAKNTKTATCSDDLTNRLTVDSPDTVAKSYITCQTSFVTLDEITDLKKQIDDLQAQLEKLKQEAYWSRP